MPFAKQQLSAYEALSEAQKIAYAPVIFQAVRALRDLGILRQLEQADESGVTATSIADVLDIDVSGVEILLESGLSCQVVECDLDASVPHREHRYFLSKIGHFLLNDRMTRVNMDFNHHVCYHGLATLDRSIRDGKPRGLDVLGSQWKTIYQAIPHLSEAVRESWYAFDHYYSDSSYPLTLPIILRSQPGSLADIGANTGKLGILLARNDPELRITLIDLPDQLEVAKQNIEAAGVQDRVTCHAMNVLDHSFDFPAGLDVYWMSQFMSCFSVEEMSDVFSRVATAMGQDSRFLILDNCWDLQEHEASAFSLVNTNPYFNCMATGKARMHHSEEILDGLDKAGLVVTDLIKHIGICHSLFECRLAR
jgi:hypothetical protein